MWSRKELKTNAKAALKNYFWKGLLAIVIASVIGSVASSLCSTVVNLCTGNALSEGQRIMTEQLAKASDPEALAQITEQMPEGYQAANTIYSLLTCIIAVLVAIPLEIGVYRFFEMSRGVKTGLGEIFTPLKKCVKIGLTMLWLSIKVFLWSLLLVVPGIIKAFEYSMVPYILAENPEISGKRAFQISKAMTKGNKWHLFVLGLSFILWGIGVVCTCGLLAIYVGPYMQATMVEAYYKLKAQAVADGATNLQELPDICLPAAQNVVPFDNAAAVPAAGAAAAAATAAAVTTPAEEAAPVEEAPAEEAPAEEAAPVEEAPAAEEVPTTEV